MSVETDIISALNTGGITNVYPQDVPDDVSLPFVVLRILTRNPLRTLDKTEHQTNTIAAFECYAASYSAAQTLAASVRTVIDGSSLVSYLDNSPGPDYVQLVDEHMEPVFYGFWHAP